MRRAVIAASERSPRARQSEAPPPDEGAGGSLELASTRWSFYLALDEGGRTLFTVDMLPDGVAQFSNSGEDGTWRARQGFVVVKQPTFLFGNDLYYSGRLVAAGRGAEPAEQDVFRLTDGIVETDKSREIVRIGAFSAHQLAPTEDDGADYEDDEDTISRILD